MIDETQKQALLSIPIESVASRLGLEERRHVSLCPFHDDHHPSLSFDVRRNRYRCFACGEHGDVIGLVMKLEGLTFPDACRWLAAGSLIMLDQAKADGRHSAPSKEMSASGMAEFDVSSYASFFEHPTLSQPARQFLFKERKLRYSVVKKLKLNSWRDRQGICWLEIPYFNLDGRLIGVQQRNLSARRSESPSNPGSAPRFRFPKGSSCHVYNLPILKSISPGDALLITEGCSDCWSALSAGYKAIAFPSASTLPPANAPIFELLNALDVQFHMFPDQDEPGNRLFAHLQSILPNLHRHQLPPSCKDFSDYYLHLKSLQEKTTIS